MEISKNKLVAVGGPTATGKSEIAVKLAQLIDGEIINADSVQVYKYMDIGSNKDQIAKTGEHLEGELADGSEVEIDAFKINGTQVTGWLFDLVTPDVNFTVADYQIL